jgi:hypothetical protein
MLCARCKGRGLCGLAKCPIISRFQASVKIRPQDSYMGSSPSIFIGSSGYPAVRGGPLLINESDAPPDWLKNAYTIDDIVGIRARTIRGMAPAGTIEESIQEIALSQTPIDVEASFHKPVHFDLTFDGTLAPVGLRGDLRRLDVLGNPRIERQVDKITSDTDLRTTEAVSALYGGGIDTYRITPLLTAGLLGVKRHIVPTRWAITAVDDMLGTDLRKRIAGNPPLETIRVFCGELYANRIICLLVPGDWKFEMVEIWQENSLWAGDTETIISDGEGRKKSGYSPIAGAYYSARLAVAEYLERIGRSARIVVVRRVTGGYWAPLGTWVIREASRKALQSQPKLCHTLAEATAHVTRCMRSPTWLAHSRLIPEIRTQRTLADF